MPSPRRNAGSRATRRVAAALAMRSRSSSPASSVTVAPSGWRTMCCLTRPVSRSLSTPIVSVARSTSYSPAWSLRALPRTRVSVMNAARLRITPASRSAAATPRTPRWAGISTTTPPASSAGAGVKISQARTVGTAYRRALLSAIHGAAPTWVKIENVLHEFSPLPGVTEDTLDIMLNLRKVVFAHHVNRPKILRLRPQGTGVVKASDFEKDADVEILTPDVPLATLDKDGVLEMEVCVERGRGYVSAEKREPEALPINAILLDADFSPVERVNFHVEAVATGRERLVLEVWTDGSVAPTAAVGEASRILEDHFALLTAFPEATPEEEAAERDETRPRTELNENLFRDAEELERLRAQYERAYES